MRLLLLFLLTVLAPPLEASPVFRDLMGLNGHTVQFRPALYNEVCRQVRDYHPVDWDLGHEPGPPPFPFAKNRVNWDTVYGQWRKDGWTIDACLMFESLQRPHWKDLAVSTREYAEQFARAFGPGGKWPHVATAEIGNEPGKYSDADYRTVLAAMAQGLRAGDPKLKIATCNLTLGKSTNYAKSVDCIRGLEGMVDILNIHVYAELKPWPTWQRSYPEDPKLPHYLNDVRDLCAWRDHHAAGKAVWVTEFGYDATSKKPDPKSEFAKWEGQTEVQQAEWIVRSWLLFSALPIERAYLYFFNDADTPHLHGSSGLTRNFQPKPAFWAAAHLQKSLGEYHFSRVLEDLAGTRMVYEFTHSGEPQRRILVAWVPTAEGLPTTYRLEIPPSRVERMPLSKDESVELPVKDGSVQISGRPVFLFY